MIKKINKKGEMTTKHLVALIVLIASFAIILFLLFRLNLGATTDKEICHNSVVLASKGQGLVGQLDCKTSYVCISGGGECNDLNPTETIGVNLNQDDEIIKKEIMDAIADEMVDCWWMFGEGELDYLRRDIKKKYFCAVCSIVKFDEEIINAFSEITYLDFYSFLESTLKSDSETYLRYLYGVGSLEQFQSEYSMNGIDVTKPDAKIMIQDRFVIVTGIDPTLTGADKIINTYFVKNDEVTDRTSCDIFDITKS